MTTVHVLFPRTHDAEEALPTVCEHVEGAHLEPEGIGVECPDCDAERIVHQLSVALDEWLVAHELPFYPLVANRETLVVCPPGD